MQARSISPPLVASSTMKSASLMIHAIEVDRAIEAAQLHAAAVRDVNANAAVAAGGRQGVRIAAELNHRRSAGRILQDRRTGVCEKADGVARPKDPSAAIRKSHHLELMRIQLATAMDHVRVFEFDALSRSAAEYECDGDQNRQQ